MKTIRHTTTLFYYDGPQIFEARDSIGGHYVAVLVEAIGGVATAGDLVLAAIASGKHVVTANKALIAERGNEIVAAARAKGVAVAFEAAVGGGIPIVKAIREGLAGNRIERVTAIINGTTNFILTAMEERGADFGAMLAEAQRLGYAEPDPTFDIMGIDAAHKLTILSSIAFGVPLRFERAYTQGIAEITAEDIEYARQLGYRIKHLAITRRRAEGIELRVHPCLVPVEHLVASVRGVMNAILVHSDAVGQSLYYGPGAGGEPTGSAVVADIVDVVHYLRIPAFDRPGVLAQIARILSEEGISIESIIQKEQAIRVEGSEAWVPVIILTQRVIERNLERAVVAIESLEEVRGPLTRIRVESFR